MKICVNDLVVICDEVEDTPERAQVNPIDEINN